jgi:phage tail-like protein
MSQTKEEIKAAYPLPAYNYRVSFGEVTVGFSEVSGLNIDYQPVTYKHGLSFWMGDKIIPGMRQAIKLTLKKGIVKSKDFLTSWFQDAYGDPFTSPKKDIVIELCNELGEAVVTWTVQGALPTKLDAPTFDANSNAVAIESLELVAHSVEVSYLP